MTTCDVVIIGGGCVGASVAYHLAELGCTDVVLLETNTLASGSTSKAAGGIRMQHADELNTRLAQRSLSEFVQFEAMTGGEIYFHQVGYLFLLTTQPDVELFRTSMRMQRTLDVPVEFLTPEAVLGHVPQLNVDGLLGATFCPLDGYATPEAVVQGYAAAARRKGVQVRQGEEVTRIVTREGRVVGVDVGDEHIAAAAA
jgi:sarcosine oxidase subunit beta